MDTSAKLLERVYGPRAASGEQGDADDEYVCHGNVRGNRRAFSLECRRLKGSWRAFEYAWFQEGEWCPVATQVAPGVTAPAGSFVLHYASGRRVVVSGRNLRSVFQLVLEHQIKYLAEADDASAHLSGDDAAIISRLEVIEPSSAAH